MRHNKRISIFVLMAPIAFLLFHAATGASQRDGAASAAPAAPTYDGDKVICLGDEVADERAGDKFFAECVPTNGYRPADDGIAQVKPPYDQPMKALGANDYKPNTTDVAHVSLGNAGNEDVPADPRQCEGFLILEWNAVRLYDGPGEDVRVYEVGTVLANGVTEATHLYVSPDEEDWYYIGQTSGDTDAADISGSGAPAGSLFRYVALCDVADGFTSGGSFPGPDIDAVEAIHWTAGDEAPTLISTTRGEGVTINDRPSPDGEAREAQPGDTFEGEAGGGVDAGGVDFEKACDILILDLSVKLRHSSILGNQDTVRFLAQLLVATMRECADSRSPGQDQDILEFELAEGGLSIEVPGDALDLTIRTAAAAVRTLQSTRYDIGHDPARTETIIEAGRDPLDVTPANPALPPFVLPGGHTVVVTGDAVGEPYVEAEIYLPMIVSK